jgi:chromosome segregation ATPase
MQEKIAAYIAAVRAVRAAEQRLTRLTDELAERKAQLDQLRRDVQAARDAERAALAALRGAI